MSYIDLNNIPYYLLEKKEVIYWTSKRSGVSVRFRAYKLRDKK